MVAHVCPVVRCGRSVSKNVLMCKPHWRLLDLNFRAKVWNLFRRRERNREAMVEYLAIREQAITVVEEKLKWQANPDSLFNQQRSTT